MYSWIQNNALLLNAVILQVRVEFSMPCACHRIAIQCCTKQCRIAVIYVCFALHCLSLVTRVLKFLFAAKNAKGPPQFLPINIHESFSKKKPFSFSLRKSRLSVWNTSSIIQSSKNFYRRPKSIIEDFPDVEIPKSDIEANVRTVLWMAPI